LTNLLVQDLGYGTVQKRHHGGVTRSSQLSVESMSPSVGRVGFSSLSYFIISF